MVREGNVSGMVRRRGEIYAVEPLGTGLHAVLKVDQSKFPPDHPPYSEKNTADPGPVKSATDPSILLKFMCFFFSPAMCLTQIDVIVAYTSDVKSQVVDVAGLAQLAVDETNESYKNSGIWVTMRLKHVYEEAAYNESGSVETDHHYFKTPNDGQLDDVHALRIKHGADIAVLLMSKDPDYCGNSGTILASGPAEAFVVVEYDCAVDNLSFPHEIGHLQGARHNPEADSGTVPYAYGHGYLYTSGGWRTIMSYNDSNCCDRIQYWSNPNKKYGGVAMGTTSTHHNVRVLNETRCKVASFRPPSGGGGC